jgi:tetratricopeptide (TPR) repeat protein
VGLVLTVAVVLGALVGTPEAGAQDDILGGDLERQTRPEDEIWADIERLSKQLESNPQNYRLHFELANLYADAGNHNEAIRSYQKALEINPKFVEAMVNLGSTYSDLELNEEAVEQFEAALALDPEDCKARSNLGNAYYSMGRYPDAMFEYRRAIDLDPKCHSAMYNIGVAFADAGLFREAVNWWKKVRQTAPGTEAARSAQENIVILERFTQAPTPPAEKEN